MLTKIFEISPIPRFVGMLQKFQSAFLPVTVKRLYYRRHIAHAVVHDFPQLWFCLRGSYTHYLDGAEYEMKRGSVIIVPPGAVHGFEAEDVELICMNFSYGFLVPLIEQNKLNSVANLFLPKFGEELGFELKSVFLLDGEDLIAAEKTAAALSSYDYNVCATDTKRLLSLCDEFFSLSPFMLSAAEAKSAAKVIKTKLEPIIYAVYYINRNYSNPLHTSELLTASTLCRTDFFKLIKKATGYTFSVYLQKLRLSYVMTMVAFSSYSFSYIASKCGFDDVSYLGKVFHRHFGKTMTETRKNLPNMRKMYPQIRPDHDFFEVLMKKLVLK